MSGALEASSRIGVARGVQRFSPARLRKRPIAVWVRLSMRRSAGQALLARLRVVQMSDIGIAVHRQTARRSIAPEPGSVESEFGDVDDIALVGNIDALAFDRIAHLS